MNLGDKILKLLLEPSLRYKGVSVSFLGLPALASYKKQSIRNSFYELKNKGYILTGEDKVKVTRIGRKYLERKLNSIKEFSSCFLPNAPKNLIVMYDIPQDKKAEREWFRWHLRKFGYQMIQKSVWVGPSPLPKEFISYVKHIHLRNCIKVLRLAGEYKADSFGL
ncbi:MAG: CRISPR-associated endonuclease Cas2 [bacterium]|nr:CRISPR-associated endonuclease Cas2 [bacterium]